MKDFLLESELPLVCTPITGKTKDEIVAELRTIVPKSPNLLEWRCDFFSSIENVEEVLETLEAINELRNDIPLLFTIRSEKEGGQAIPLDEKQIFELLKKVCESPFVEMIDYEVMNKEAYVHALRETSKEHGKKLVLSFHNFRSTPSKQELLQLLSKMEAYGADVAKVAVMPKTKEDVLLLLNATKEANDRLTIPVATMAMGELGAISRIIGWYYGSALTFAVGHESSAPGQLPIETLQQLITMIKHPK